MGELIGFYLRGTFINFNEVKDWFGMSSHSSGLTVNYGSFAEGSHEGSGILINYGTIETEYFGRRSSGIIANCGDGGESMGDEARGIILGLKDPKSYGDLSNAKLVLKEADCKELPELVDYFGTLKENFNMSNYLATMKVLRPNPRAKVEAEILTILRGYNYEV
jgi:hypothetical protein